MKLTFGRFLLLVIVISAAGIFTGWILRGEPTPDQTGTLGDAASTSSFLDPRSGLFSLSLSYSLSFSLCP